MMLSKVLHIGSDAFPAATRGLLSIAYDYSFPLSRLGQHANGTAIGAENRAEECSASRR